MFLTFEGIDGSGKSTQIGLFTSYLEANNFKFIATREPGGSVVSEKLRDILLDKNNILHENTELFMILAARSEHFQRLIKPSLENGQIVVCDRFIDSTIAYQGYARNYDKSLIHNLNNIVTENTKPDLTIYFDVKVDIAFSRLNDNLDRFEQEGKAFQVLVRNGFLDIAKENPDRFKVIETDGLSMDDIHREVVRIFHRVYGKS